MSDSVQLRAAGVPGTPLRELQDACRDALRALLAERVSLGYLDAAPAEIETIVAFFATRTKMATANCLLAIWQDGINRGVSEAAHRAQTRPVTAAGRRDREP